MPHLGEGTHGETVCTRNIDEVFQEGTATVCAGRRCYDGDELQWMIVTWCMGDCVEVTMVKLDDETNLVKDAIIVHEGDLACKKTPFEICIKDNCKNMARWLWQHGTLRTPCENLKCHEVARHV